MSQHRTLRAAAVATPWLRVVLGIHREVDSAVVATRKLAALGHSDEALGKVGRAQSLDAESVRQQVRDPGDSPAESVLKDPDVQRAIAEASKKYAKDKAKNVTMKDVAAQGTKIAGEAVKYANTYVGNAGSVVADRIEQGPAGVRFLAFIGGIVSFGLCVGSLMNPCNMFAAISYIMSAYQALFAAATMLFEADPAWVSQITLLSETQDLLMENCKFLTLTGGRGLFYIFQGSLWMVQCAGFGQWHLLAAGLYMIFIGAVHVSMHFGAMPHDIASKFRL